MQDIDLFQLALGLSSPWTVTRSEFAVEDSRLDLYVDFARGSRFACAQCGREGCAVHDTKEETWRHLDFFQHRTLLHARVPRVTCPQCGVLANEAVDQVRREEARNNFQIKGRRYIFLKNVDHLTLEEKEALSRLEAQNLDTIQAMQIRMNLQQLFAMSARSARLFLDRWNVWVEVCDLGPMKKLAKTIMAKSEGILRSIATGLSNGVLEAINGNVQAAKRKAKGYRTKRNLKAIVYLIAGDVLANSPI
jgi:transposase